MHIAEVARDFADAGFKILSSKGTGKLIQEAGIDVEIVNKLSEGRPNILDLITNGKINKDTVIIEPTSGNTGIGLAFVTAAKGLHLILTMPDTMSMERRKIVRALGAQIVLTQGRAGMRGAIEKAAQLKEEYGNAFIPQQFENEANPAIHKKTTAQEIWEDTDGNVDIFVASVGTGGTLTGTGEGLREHNPDVKKNV